MKIKKHVVPFGSWYRMHESQEPNIDLKLTHLRRLIELGLIPPSRLEAELRKMKASDFLNADDIYREILDSPELAEFKDRGLDIVSSSARLANRTLAIGYPDYNSREKFAIGFYPFNRVIKRLYPQGINMGIWGRAKGAQDVKIKEFPDVFSNDVEFYRKAMRWALDHLDFTAINNYSNSPYFPVKTRTRRGYFEEMN